MTHRALVISGIVKGKDDEPFWKRDQYVHRSLKDTVLILSNDKPSGQVRLDDIKWGGECRVETIVEAKLASNSDQISVTATSKFYEGTSSDTNDLEDTESESVVVPKFSYRRPSTSSIYIKLKNEGLGRGDWANVSLDFINVSADEN